MVTPKTRAIIWAKSAGHCEYPACNVSLIGDLISGNEDGNFGLIAHIVGEKPDGPRGDPVRSPALSDDPNNLMLLCYKHHKLIDVEGLSDHPESLLLTYKVQHEERIRIVTEIHADRASHVLRYGAKIGEQSSPVSLDRCRIAMLPHRYPVDGRSIGIQILGNAGSDKEDEYWTNERDNLRRQFGKLIRERIADGEINHLSVFALAPIPLLVELGTMLGDITPADVFQLHREPAGWSWASDGKPVVYHIKRPSTQSAIPALVLSISGSVNKDRIKAVLGDGIAIWHIAAENPHNDVVRDPADLVAFRQLARSILNEIKAASPQASAIHIFPAVPISIAVELGRVRMPKADLPLIIYDETKVRGFVARVAIS